MRASMLFSSRIIGTNLGITGQWCAITFIRIEKWL